MSEEVFGKLSCYIEKQSGIQMPVAKKTMLEGRLRRRLRELGMSTFDEYCDFLFSRTGSSEIVHMLDAVTTNKTEFFREPLHFEYLRQTILPEFIKKHQGEVFNIWSAGCSTGEEPYTIAVVLSEFARTTPAFRFSVFATDLSTTVLEKARQAIYTEDKISHIPAELQKKYFARSRDRSKKLVRVSARLRAAVEFRRLNFMSTSYPLHNRFHVIFCRNVMIYFDRETKKTILHRLCGTLKPGGYFILGHSESITTIETPLTQVAPTVHRLTL
jgi:chemotaxis protein methyltransferase CheR